MIQILFFIIFQAPELELPYVTIYGERAGIEIVKKSLLPDSVFPLAIINEYIPKAVKLRAMDVVCRKDYTARFRVEGGSSGRIRSYAGFKQYSLSALYDKDVIGLKERVGLNLGLPYARVFYDNVSFKGGKRLLSRKYCETGLKFSFARRPFFIDGGIAKTVLAGDENNVIILNTAYNTTYLDITNKTKIYTNDDFISSVSVGFPLHISNFALSTGIFAALSNSRELSRVYPIFSMMNIYSDFSLSLSYSPYTTILGRNELLTINPFCSEARYDLNTSSLVELVLNSKYGEIKAGYQENYPVFYYDTTVFSIKDTNIYFLEARTEWHGFKLDIEYRHNVSDYMPYLSISPEIILSWRGLDCSVSSPVIFRQDPAGSYTTLTVSLLYTIFQNFSLILDANAPFGKTEQWKGCDKERERVYLGVALNL